MLGKMKQWLGIEGVKVEFEISPTYDLSESEIHAALLFSTMHPQEIEKVEITLIEIFRRGKGDDKRIDEYTLGKKIISKPFSIKADTSKRIPFILDYTRQESSMDKYQKNKILNPIISLAKWSQSVKSIYKLQAKVTVKGTRLNPFIEEEITFD